MRHRRTPKRPSAGLAKASFDEVSKVSFKGAQAGVEEFTLGDYDDVKSWRDFVSTENLSNQSFSSISLNRAADFLGRCDSESSNTPLIGEQKDRGVPAMYANTVLVHLLELRPAADVFDWTESQSYSLLTVRRLRPLARRRFNTSRPFFVLMRTRNPCVFAR